MTPTNHRVTIEQLVESLPSSIIWKCYNYLQDNRVQSWTVYKGKKNLNELGRKFSRHCTPYSHRQHQEVGADVVSGAEFQFQTKAKHYPQSKTFPALKGKLILIQYYHISTRGREYRCQRILPGYNATAMSYFMQRWLMKKCS